MAPSQHRASSLLVFMVASLALSHAITIVRAATPAPLIQREVEALPDGARIVVLPGTHDDDAQREDDAPRDDFAPYEESYEIVADKSTPIAPSQGKFLPVGKESFRPVDQNLVDDMIKAHGAVKDAIDQISLDSEIELPEPDGFGGPPEAPVLKMGGRG